MSQTKLFTHNWPQKRNCAGSLLAAVALLAGLAGLILPMQVSAWDKTQFQRVQTRFIAALDDPDATSGGGAQFWGIWTIDPGPRGVWLKDYPELEAAGGKAPANWQFDKQGWWVEENGLIMEQPNFPIPAGKYIVTGGREVVTLLTIHPADASGDQKWELEDGATLYDVTHLPCRSARYTSASGSASGENLCSPTQADTSQWPVTPGALMPTILGCQKQDYAVLFIVALPISG